MLCLIKSQVLLHIIDADNPFPKDKGDHMIEQYEEVVKGWIFSSVNEKVLNDIIDLGTVREMWMRLESDFNPPISATEVNVYVPDVSPVTEDLKYIQASSVNVSSFISVKLSGHLNYDIWKAQFICLVQSQDLLYILSNEYRFPPDKGAHRIEQYDKLVKGWILSSMNEKVLNYFINIYYARDLWTQLDVVYSPPRLFTVGDSWNTPPEYLKYMQTSSVNVSHYVKEKLSSSKNFSSWSSDMLQLIDSHQLRHIIDEGSPFPEDKGFHMINYYDRLVKDWFFSSADEKVLRDFQHCNFTRHLLRELQSTFTVRYYFEERYSPDATKDLRYIQTSSVDVSNFVSVKLSGHSNYPIWKAQMTLLLECQGLLHIIDSQKPSPYENDAHMFWQYSELVRGWIFSSMNEKLLKCFIEWTTVKNIWSELEFRFDPSITNREVDPVGFSFKIETVQADAERESISGELLSQSDQDIDSDTRKRLYEAAVNGCWWKAKSILKVCKNAAMKVITGNGNTILHIAVEMGHNYFLEKLLDYLKDEKDIIKTQNYKGRTALHTAALVGNEYAAQLLVQKMRELLEFEDCNRKSPFHIAQRKINMPAYMLKSAPDSDLGDYSDEHRQMAIASAIFTKQYDLAETLLRKFPECAKKSEDILFSMAITFPTHLGFMEAFMYPSFHNVRLKIITVCSYLSHSIFWDKCVDDILRAVKICSNMCCSWLGEISMILLVPIATLYPLYLLICLLILVLHLTFSVVYFLLWKVLAVIEVYPIKKIEKKMKEYKEGKNILSLICEQMGASNSGYRESIIEAVRQGAYEVVDEILFASPVSINYVNEEGHNIIQLAIINRSEKVYNLIRHIIERTEYYRVMDDYSKNSLLHLAGRLAPSFVLNRSTGAALQLQRELLWREEVKKLIINFEFRNENIDNESPTMMFTREHQELIKEGENWMKTTAESCSITAALIVTVVFAAAITVPGGSNQESGIPVFKKEIAFTVFAISNAFSLFTAATALLLFLSILTARFAERDFLVSLPRRLIFGLFTLFLSTTSMIVAFAAILFLVFCDQRPWMLAPISGFACLPIFVIVSIKVPLLVDLIKSTYFPIFGEQSYLESCKTNRKNTIFVD